MRLTSAILAAATLGMGILSASAQTPAAPAAKPTSAPMAKAQAALKGVDGADHGTVTFEETASGVVRVVATLKGVPAGQHGFHIHTTGKCDAATKFESAGGHFAGTMEHGAMSAKGPHPGDFPNLRVPASQAIEVEFFSSTDKLGKGLTNLFDADGASLIVHAKADDYTTQPSGAAGDRLACGVITKG